MTIGLLPINEKSLERIVKAIRELSSGRSNAAGPIALNVSPSTSTIVDAPGCGEGSTPILTPMNSAAASEVGAGTLYISAVARGSFTITHSSSGSTRNFRYAFQG